MYLPSLSFHSSLEEQWNEEEEQEEIETLPKGVPPSYHQYFDVFSKLKEGKGPPHHTCDHHINWRGVYLQLVLSALHQIMSQKHYMPTFQRM
ncbi:hypothetical protein O181_046791 [Austropuccinia psidii MF-1]|uniref:Uncharacterized protein n=1 Tax=Austropuccinia psidii MF-1 TaxID=1389203 RepID=A0A9Q3DML8_9BASI|nr:hypothetical protein [Austropuccinia psidii MF-1]